MARSRTETSPPLARLYLLVPASGAAEEIARLSAEIRRLGEQADIAAVLLRTGISDATPDAKNGGEALSAPLRPLVEAAHAIEAACLIEGNTALAGTLGADGAHLDGTAALRAALPILRPDGIAGTGGLRSKHDAMTAGELGTDYVMFGEPDASGRRPPFETTLERIDWWAQLFEPPCVGHAASLDEVSALAKAGADFIAVDALLLDKPGGAQEVMARIAEMAS